jgi:hypothetical protein
MRKYTLNMYADADMTPSDVTSKVNPYIKISFLNTGYYYYVELV